MTDQELSEFMHRAACNLLARKVGLGTLAADARALLMREFIQLVGTLPMKKLTRAYRLTDLHIALLQQGEIP